MKPNCKNGLVSFEHVGDLWNGTAYANASSRAGDSPGNHFQCREYQLVIVD